MTGEIIKLKLVEIGEDVRLDAGAVLDGAKEEMFERMAVLGTREDGSLYVAGTANAGETMILIERAKHFLVFGKDEAMS
jgi:hypothetical protein